MTSPLLTLIEQNEWDGFQPMMDDLARWEGWPLFLEKLKNLRRDALYQSDVHGLGHIERTMLHGAFCAMTEPLDLTDTALLLECCAYHDVGHALNPALVRGQIYGGILMGMGFGLYEEYRLDQGVSPDTNLDAYPIATAKDAPIVDIKLYECADPEGTYGAKSIAENASEMIGAACALAVKHAIKRPVRRVPLTPEYVLELLARGEDA